MPASGDGGGGTSSSTSTRVSSVVTSEDDAAEFGSTGRTDFTEAHGNVFALGVCWAAHPVKTTPSAHNPRYQKRTRAQREPARDLVDLCVINDQAASGNSMRNVVPRPTSDVKSIEPLWSCTIRNVLASPIPLPPGRVVKKSWKIFCLFSCGIPFPVSPTLISAISPR